MTVFSKNILIQFSALLIAASLLFTPLSAALASSTWTDQTGSGARSWTAITSSSDGTKLAAATFFGDIYTSIDSGVTWTDQTASGLGIWYTITSSSDGTKLAAAGDSGVNGYIHTSTDSGATWTEQTGSGSRDWGVITSSSDGTKLAASQMLGNIYTSTDSGVTWTPQTDAPAARWNSITSSSDGTKLAAANTNGDIYTSTNSGVNWTHQTGAGVHAWRGMTSSSDGTKLAAVINSGDIYTSIDSGVTWTDQTASGARSWLSITSSGDGTKLAATVSGGDIYRSTDSGVTWVSTGAGNQGWFNSLYQGITSSSDGKKLAAITNSGDIWTADYSIAAPTLTTSAASSVATSTATLNGSITATGGADATQSGFAYGTVANLSTVIATSTLGSQTGTASFTQNLTGLTPNTTYYFRAYATNTAGTGYGSILSFTTSAVAAPTLTTQAVSAITGTTATGNGTITVTGNINPTVRGMVYGTSISYGATTTASGDFSTGVFTSPISGLTCGTLYHAGAYATNSQGTGYGSDVMFTTDSCPVVAPPPAPTGGGGILGLVGTPGGSYHGPDYIAPRPQIIYPDGRIVYLDTSPSPTSSSMPTNTLPGPTSSSIAALVAHNYQYRVTNENIRTLQQFLNVQGFTVAQTGAGSPGHETTYFGLATLNALTKFQKAHGLPSTGYFGPLTRALVQKLSQ